ncbi:MAG: DUF366 family protein [Pseudobdellovibrio sp.]
MKSKFFKQKIKYDGSQLTPLFAYQNFKISGDSIVSWVGPCDVTLEHMVDFEDKIAHEKICGDLMLHFIIEVFPGNLPFGVSLQRLFAALALEQIRDLSPLKKLISFRDGDDIYVETGQNNIGKLSISIASVSAVSTQIHFAINIVNSGTPVKTVCLEELKVDSEQFAKRLMSVFVEEYESILFATQKVKPL